MQNLLFHFFPNSLTLILLSITFLKQVKSQFVRTCTDPLVVDHINKFSHTYCEHACGFLVAGTTGNCEATGFCACSYPCSDDPAQLAMTANGFFAPDVCPPFPGDLPDTDPTAIPMCQATCAGFCAGGVGMVCGEVSALGPNNDMFGKICTCSCPALMCNPTTPNMTTPNMTTPNMTTPNMTTPNMTTTNMTTASTTTTPTTTTIPPPTTTTLATTTTTRKSVVLFKKPVFKILWKVKKVLIWTVKKILSLAVIAFKLFFAYFLQWLFIGIYYFVMRHVISWELRVLSEWLWWIFSSIIRS